MAIPFSAYLDIAYVGQHSYGFPQQTNINAIDFGTAFLPSSQDPTQTSTIPGAASIAALNPDLARYYRGYGTINVQQAVQTRTYHSLQLSVNRRLVNGLALGFADTINLYDHQTTTLRLQHNADGTVTTRADQKQADELLGNNNPQTHVMRANFVWRVPRINGAPTTLDQLLKDWSVSGIWSAATGAAYVITPSYTSNGANVNLTGSPDYAARVNVIGDPGAGCNPDPLRQFNTAAFSGPVPGSVGLESGNGYLRGCFISQMDLSLAREIRLGVGSSSVQLRLDVFNLFNQAAVTDRNRTMQMASPSTPNVITNLPFGPGGNVIETRSRPRGAGFGVATNYQDPRTMQLQVRFSF